VKRALQLVVVVLLALAGWAALTAPPRSVRLRLPPAAPSDPRVLRGAYHVHSRASDGTGTIPEIAAAAGRAGLRFVIITDHGNALRRPAPPRYVGGVLCIEAVEISTVDGHYAALGLASPPYPLGGEARDVVEDVARLGGFGIAAHPESAKRALRWDAWETPFDGLEWFNADSEWRDERRWRLLPALLQYPWRPAETVASLFDRPSHLLRRWDELTQGRHVVALAAADAHARMGLGGKADPYDEAVYVKAPSYESIFRAFSLRVELPQALTGDPAADAEAVLAAVRAGHVYTAFDAVAGPAWLAFCGESGGRSARQGDDLALSGRATIRAGSNGPPGTTLVLLRNGDEIRTSSGPTLEWADDRPGAYRVEARTPAAPGDPPLPWILSNPIYVGMPAQKARRDPIAPARDRLVLPAGSWRVEKDTASAGSFERSPSGNVVRHTLRFQLGRGAPSPFVALVTSDVGPLHDAARIGFRAGASRPLRLSVQVRVVRGRDEQRWQRSVYLAEEPRDIVVIFTDMRPAGSADRRPFDPAQIESLLFVFDTTNARPGDGGVAWVEGLRTER
jgi:hypothetical protein